MQARTESVVGHRHSIGILMTVWILGCGGPTANRGDDDDASASNGGAGGSAKKGGTGGSAKTAGTSGTRVDDEPGGKGGSNSGGSASGGAAMGGTGGDAGTTPAPEMDLALPVAVTTHWGNQGWFGDAMVSAAFVPGTTIIKQATSTTGPCATRPEDARGSCLAVEYTPPADLQAPEAGGFVGVFFLTSLAKEHPELIPPAKAGEANWGVEPAKHIAPGAKTVSFHVAGAIDGAEVFFKAGTMDDRFIISDTPVTLTTSWKKYELPLDGQTYNSPRGVIGAFAWVIKQTTQPVTFYIDGIVWE